MMTFNQWLATDSIRIQAYDMTQRIARLDPFQPHPSCWQHHYLPELVQYGRPERNIYGYEFPMYEGELLSWSIGLYMTLEQERLGYPKARIVIQAMQDRRPKQLALERYEMLRGSFDRMFGHNARKVMELIDEVTSRTVTD
jgi:hypothetical protein